MARVLLAATRTAFAGGMVDDTPEPATVPTAVIDLTLTDSEDDEAIGNFDGDVGGSAASPGED
jgi:FlaG/FlaF family flagellin (archaellin)